MNYIQCLQLCAYLFADIKGEWIEQQVSFTKTMSYTDNNKFRTKNPSEYNYT